MRGYKAKVLRRIALAVEPSNEPGYVYPKGRYIKVKFKDLFGNEQVFLKSGIAVLASKADRLYNSMKRDMTRGGC